MAADWSDAYRANRYLHGIGTDSEAAQVLADFRRFPAAQAGKGTGVRRDY